MTKASIRQSCRRMGNVLARVLAMAPFGMTASVPAMVAGLAISLTALAAPLEPTRFNDFDHYTLALSWQPGFCRFEGQGRAECAYEAMAGDQPLALHGLWPSLPASLRARGVDRQEWWQSGCYHFSGEPQGGFCRIAPLKLDDDLRSRLSQAMPGTQSCLDRHEYTKHAACFGLAAGPFFEQALSLMTRVETSGLADFLRARAGTRVRRSALIRSFRDSFDTEQGAALRLTCIQRDGVAWLEGVAIGIHREQLADFPAPSALAPLEPGNCPSQLLLAAPDVRRP